MDPEIIFCDEPSAGLDPITAVELDGLLLNLRDSFGITFMVVTHELRSIERIADKVMVLRENEVYFAGSFKELFKLNDPFINSFFLKENKNG
jgi:phospholipid/cholesterol/gamma-HCH transport system ATP-binding protein